MKGTPAKQGIGNSLVMSPSSYSIVPMAFGNMALDLVMVGTSGRLVSIHNGNYDTVPISVVTGQKKVVNVENVLQHRAFAAEIRIVPAPAAVHHDQRYLEIWITGSRYGAHLH